MTITIQLQPDIERRLAAKAAQNGQDVQSVIAELIERGMKMEPSLKEILAPFRAQVAVSGMNERELTELFEEMRAHE